MLVRVFSALLAFIGWNGTEDTLHRVGWAGHEGEITVLPASIQIKRATMAQAEVSSERVFGDIDDISRQIIRVVGDAIVSRVELLIVSDNRSDRGQ